MLDRAFHGKLQPDASVIKKHRFSMHDSIDQDRVGSRSSGLYPASCGAQLSDKITLSKCGAFEEVGEERGWQILAALQRTGGHGVSTPSKANMSVYSCNKSHSF